MPKENELGTLIVVVLKARNLNDNHSFYKQDVFAQVTLNDFAIKLELGATKRTHIDVKGGQHPVWDVELRFPVLKNTAEKYRKLEVACYCKEHKSEDILGNGSVDITETLKTGEFDEWIPLNIDGVVRGDIYLEMTFYINTPAPATSLAVPVSNQVLTRRPSKLSPLDRLYRPPQNLVPAVGRPSNAISKTHSGPWNSTSHSGGEPPLRPSSSAPPVGKRSESPLPPFPEQLATPALPLPQTLMPRGGQLLARLSDHQPPEIPSILRPRSEIVSPIHTYSQMPPVAQRYEASIPVPVPHPDQFYYAQPNSPTFEYSTTVPRASYHASTTSTILAVPYRPLSTSPQTDGLKFVPSGPPSFPIPSVAPLGQNGTYPGLGPPPLFYRPPEGNDFPDPYLQARYQTPLPLPPGSTYLHGNPTALPQSEHDKPLIDAPPLKKEEVMRQRTQEEEDREFALQLDRELNLAS